MTLRRPTRRALFLALAPVLVVGASCTDSPERLDIPGGGRAPTTLERGVTTTAVPPVSAAVTSETSVVLEPGVTSNNVGGPLVACKVGLTGARTATFNAYDDSSAFSSDHYLSEAELEQARNTPRSTLVGITAPPFPAGAAPVAGWFILTCQGGDITLSITSDPRSTADDIPFEPAKYTIGSGTGDPKELVAVVSFFRDPSQLWAVEPGATLTVDRFDGTGAAGSFDIPMRRRNVDGTETEDLIRFTGAFAVACHSGSRCQQR